MWSRLPIYCWPAAWLSLWLAGAATGTAWQLSMTAPRRPLLRLRTPLLTLHVSTLRLRPHAGQQKPCEMHRPNLHLVKPGCEGN